MEPLLRCLLAFFLTWYILKKAYRRKSLSYSGCIAAFFVGTIVSYSNLCHLTSLLTFFYASNKATRFRQHLKVKLDDDFKFDGQRNAYQVISNGFFATFFSYFYIIECGYGERPIDFEHDYKATWYSIAVLSILLKYRSLCCMCGDTFSSELGPVLGSKNNIISPTSDQVFHIIKFKRVPKGTNGGISLLGTLASFYGGLLVGLTYYLTLKVCLFVSGTNFGISSDIPQWPIILIGALSGLVGSLIDSVLGGYFQYSGINKKTRAIVSEPDPPQVEHISGYNLLSNNQVNFFSCLLISLLAPYFAFKFYKNYVLPIRTPQSII